MTTIEIRDAIESKVCEKFGITVDVLHYKTRYITTVKPRQIAMKLMRDNITEWDARTKRNLPIIYKNIAKYYLMEKHSIVIHACRLIENLPKTDKYKKIYEELKTENQWN